MDSNLEKILEIAEYLGLANVVSQIQRIISRSKQENACLVLPLVGEFSAGKTSLLNALSDSKGLETAWEPTTKTIFELHFSCDRCHAQILKDDGKIEEIDNISLLKNDDLTDTKVVTVFDTSKRVPPTTILVDTPGLSSSDPAHKQTLVEFLPKADGILLVVDVNQQITRSLTDFVETMKLSKKPIFLILSKCDTKAPGEIEKVKQNICENCKIPLKQVAAVSVLNEQLDSLYELLADIQKDKDRILKEVDGMRVKNIIDKLSHYIDELMNATSSDKEMDSAIRRSQYELDKVKRTVDRLSESISEELEETQRLVIRKFEDLMSTKLNTLINSKSTNFDRDAISAVNTTVSLLINDFKTQVGNILANRAKSTDDIDGGIRMNSLDDIDLSAYDISGLSYNLELNNMGHEYDSWIKTGVIATAAIATVGAAAYAGGGLAAIATVDNVIDVADTVTDVGSMVSNRNTVNRINQAVGFASQVSSKYVELDERNRQTIEQSGNGKGMIDSMVGFVTDKLMSKPQRTRAVRVYIDETLVPEFKLQLTSISQALTNAVRSNIQNEASAIIEQKADSLNQLKKEQKEQKDLFTQRMDQLRSYKTILLTL